MLRLLLVLLFLPSLAFGQSLIGHHPMDINKASQSVQGLVGWWPGLAHLSGGPKWYDWMGRNPGTLTSGPTWGAPSCPGTDGELRFDGSNDYVDVGDRAPLKDVVARSIVVRAKVNGFGANGKGMMMAKRAEVGGWHFKMNNADVSNGIGFLQDWSGGTGNWALANVITTGNCYTLGVTYDGNSTSNTPTFYVDGVAYTSGSYTTIGNPSGTITNDNGSTLRIGDEGGTGDRAFNGSILDVRFYNRILSADEMREIHRSMAKDQRYAGMFLRPLEDPLPFTPAVANRAIPRRLVIE